MRMRSLSMSVSCGQRSKRWLHRVRLVGVRAWACCCLMLQLLPACACRCLLLHEWSFLPIQQTLQHHRYPSWSQLIFAELSTALLDR
jgi:hypothetical protein